MLCGSTSKRTEGIDASARAPLRQAVATDRSIEHHHGFWLCWWLEEEGKEEKEKGQISNAYRSILVPTNRRLASQVDAMGRMPVPSSASLLLLASLAASLLLAAASAEDGFSLGTALDPMRAMRELVDFVDPVDPTQDVETNAPPLMVLGVLPPGAKENDAECGYDELLGQFDTATKGLERYSRFMLMEMVEHEGVDFESLEDAEKRQLSVQRDIFDTVFDTPVPLRNETGCLGFVRLNKEWGIEDEVAQVLDDSEFYNHAFVRHSADFGSKEQVLSDGEITRMNLLSFIADKYLFRVRHALAHLQLRPPFSTCRTSLPLCYKVVLKRAN